MGYIATKTSPGCSVFQAVILSSCRSPWVASRDPSTPLGMTLSQAGARCFGAIPTRSMVAHYSMRRPSAQTRASSTSLSSRRPNLTPKGPAVAGRVNRKKLKSRSRLFSFARDCSPANERNDLQEAARDRGIRARRRVHAKADEATRRDDSRGTRLSLGRRLQDREKGFRDSCWNG